MKRSDTGTTSTAKGRTDSRLPDTWPGAFDAYKFSRDAVKHNLVPLLQIWVGYFVIVLIVTGASHSTTAASALASSLVSFLLGSVFTVITTRIFLACVRGRHMSVSEAFGGDLPQLTLRMIGLEILVVLSIVGSFALLILPALFVIPRLSLAPYFLIDKDSAALDAYKASWAATKGHSLKVWGIIGVSFLMLLPIVTIVGAPVSLYLLFMYSAANAVLYAYLLQHPAPSTTA